MGMVAVRGLFLAYFSPYNILKKILAIYLWLCVSVSVAAGEHWWIDPRAEARLSFTDNALLTQSARMSDTVLNVSPGLNARIETKRITAGVDYSLDYFYFLSDGSTDTRHNLFGTLDAEVIEDHLSIGARASLRQQFIDQRGSLSNNFANKTNNRRLLQNYTGTAILKGGMRDVADWRFTYRYGLTRSPADNLADLTLPVNFSDTSSHEIVASVGSGDRFNNFEWRLFADSSRVLRNLDVNNFRNEHAGGELTYKFNRFIRVIGSLNYSRNDLQTAVLSEDGFGWQAGFRWTPGPKLDLTVLAGKEGLRQTWNASMQYFLSARLQFTGNYQDIITANTIVTNDSLQGFNFDQQLGISDSNGLPVDETDPVFTFSDTDFRRRSARGTFTLLQKRTRIFLSANTERRTFDSGNGTASSWGVTTGFTRDITERSTLSGSLGYRRSGFEGQTRVDNYIEAKLDWTATLSRYFKAAVGLSHSERQSNEIGADLEENSLTFYLRGTF